MDNQLKQELAKIEIPKELHERSKVGIRKAKSEMGGIGKRFMRKRMVPAIIAATLMIPTGAFAYNSLLADDLYGSFENLQKHVANATMKGYLLLNAKLDQAYGDLGKEQYKEFKELLNVITSAKLEYGDKNGNIDYTKLSDDQLENIKEAMYTIQPYFDKLNGLPSSKEVLTPDEYEQYIQALMIYETAMVLSETSTVPVLEELPADYQEKYSEASKVLDYVNEKQIQN